MFNCPKTCHIKKSAVDLNRLLHMPVELSLEMFVVPTNTGRVKLVTCMQVFLWSIRYLSRNSGRPTCLSLHIRFCKDPFSGSQIVSCLQKVRRTEFSYHALRALAKAPKTAAPRRRFEPWFPTLNIADYITQLSVKPICAVGRWRCKRLYTKSILLVLAYTFTLCCGEGSVPSRQAVLRNSRYAWGVIL
jgi:hypothetical protein